MGKKALLERILKQLGAQVADKKVLLAAEEDVANKESISDAILELTKQIGATEVEISLCDELDEASRTNAQGRSIQAIVPEQPVEPAGLASGIEVGTPPIYKSFRLKREIEAFRTEGGMPENIRKGFEDHPERAERVARMMIDLIDAGAVKTPGEADARRKAAMQEGTESEGGYAVFEENRAEILAYQREVSFGIRYCDHYPMTSDTLNIPVEATKASVAITAEESAATESEPTLGEVTLTAKRVDTFSKVSNELIQDWSIPGGVTAFLYSQLMEAIGQKIDSVVFVGTGDPMSGLFRAAGYSDVFDTGSTAFSELLVSNLRGARKKIPAYYIEGKNLAWYMHQETYYDYILGLEDDNGRPLYQPNGYLPVPEQVMGYSVRMPSLAPSTSAASTGFMAFGDLKGIAIGDRLTNLSMLVDPYTVMANHQTKFYLFTRWAWAWKLANLLSRIATGAAS